MIKKDVEEQVVNTFGNILYKNVVAITNYIQIIKTVHLYLIQRAHLAFESQ
jgi:hypothetical protein